MLTGRLIGLLSWSTWKINAEIALIRLAETAKEHPADAHETYFTANGENYRIRIDRIPNDSGVRRKGESNANT